MCTRTRPPFVALPPLELHVYNVVTKEGCRLLWRPAWPRGAARLVTSRVGSMGPAAHACKFKMKPHLEVLHWRLWTVWPCSHILFASCSVHRTSRTLSPAGRSLLSCHDYQLLYRSRKPLRFCQQQHRPVYISPCTTHRVCPDHTDAHTSPCCSFEPVYLTCPTDHRTL